MSCYKLFPALVEKCKEAIGEDEVERIPAKRFGLKGVLGHKVPSIVFAGDKKTSIENGCENVWVHQDFLAEFDMFLVKMGVEYVRSEMAARAQELGIPNHAWRYQIQLT